MTRTRLTALVLLLASLASLALALASGSLPIGFSAVFDSIAFPAPGIVHDVIWNLRAPRAFAAYACGALLALAGALLQVLLRNALADPYVLGVSGGASLGALIAIAAGLSAAAMNALAFAGAIGALFLTFGLAYRSGDWDVYRLLLTGIVVSAGLSALISLALVLAPEAQVKGMLFWLMGDLTQAGSALPAWIVLAVVAIGGIVFSHRLDLLALGDLKARSLGLDVPALQLCVFVGAAAATVAAVVLGGAIGFVGLMSAHAVRLAGISAHRALLPLAAMLGGALLTAADTMARTLWAPQQLPVGVVTAIVGVPAMLLLLSRHRDATVH